MYRRFIYPREPLPTDHPPPPSSDAGESRLPLQYEDGPDYCTVKDAQGRDFALTMQPDLMRAMEKALSTEITGFILPHKINPAEVSSKSEYGWLIEAPGQRYLAARHVGDYHFHWTQDHDAALRFHCKTQCDAAMMAIRQLAPALFDFERTLGNAAPVEHGWH